MVKRQKLVGFREPPAFALLGAERSCGAVSHVPLRSLLGPGYAKQSIGNRTVDGFRETFIFKLRNAHWLKASGGRWASGLSVRALQSYKERNAQDRVDFQHSGVLRFERE